MAFLLIFFPTEKAITSILRVETLVVSSAGNKETDGDGDEVPAVVLFPAGIEGRPNNDVNGFEIRLVGSLDAAVAEAGRGGSGGFV
jgi:hypothetical protein